MSQPCTWHPLLRWLLFLPAGIAAMSLAEFFVRITQHLNGNGYYIGECLASAIEPWAFLTASLWILPRFQRTLTVMFAVPYICFRGFILYLDLWKHDWWAALIPFIGIVSAALTARYYYREYSRELLPIAGTDLAA
jgi:hypothetical protein